MPQLLSTELQNDQDNICQRLLIFYEPRLILDVVQYQTRRGAVLEQLE